MDYEHFMRARVANGAQLGEPMDPLTVAKAITHLGGLLQETVFAATGGVAALNDMIEAGAEDGELFSNADVLGTQLAQVIAVAYRLAASLWIPEFEGRIGAILLNAAQ